MKKPLLLTFALVLLFCAAALCETDYSDPYNWLYYETDRADTQADVFFLAPTATTGDAGHPYWADFHDEKYYNKFAGAVNMQKDLYGRSARFFAPLYHEAFLTAYYEGNTDEYLDAAYEDVRSAFMYYMEHDNNGRPVVIAGFSQGSQMSLRLIKEFFAGKDAAKQLVACYAVGWRITDEELGEYPGIGFARGETDTGVIVAFTCEAEHITNSLIIPEGTRTLCINPLTWTTDTAYAYASLNEGACFLNTDGSVNSEIPCLTGCYIDPVRGALKVPDVAEEDYPAGLKGFEQGIYHLYDYQFFYRNLQKNVEARIANWTDCN